MTPSRRQYGGEAYPGFLSCCTATALPDYQALAGLMAPVDDGADTVIKVDANTSMFLHDVTVASLKPVNFSFSHTT